MKIFLFCALCLVLACSLAAQEGAPRLSLKVDVEFVELHVTVVDGKDRPVGGLAKEHFKILENQVEQQIAVFKHEDIPVSLGLVIDNSRSIEPRKERLDAAALSFVRHSNPDDETFIVHFDFDARLSQDFTANEQILEKTLSSAKPYGQTAVYDALVLALDNMAKARHTRKALLLITDGIDNGSKSSLAEIIERVKRDKVTIFSVGLLSESGGLRVEDSLIRIAESSGGRAYFPENVDQARDMMERIAHDLREQYTLGYIPTNTARDGAWRSVRVQVSAPKGFPTNLDANYRHGYYAPN